MSTSSVCHFGTEIDMNLRFFALVHKYSLVLDPIRIEKVIFFRFFFGGGGYPLKAYQISNAKYGFNFVISSIVQKIWTKTNSEF